MGQPTSMQAVEILADLCRVTRDGEDVVIHFGQTVEAAGAVEGVGGATALQAQALGRIAMSESGAARLQDLMVDLLRQPLPGNAGQP